MAAEALSSAVEKHTAIAAPGSALCVIGRFPKKSALLISRLKYRSSGKISLNSQSITNKYLEIGDRQNTFFRDILDEHYPESDSLRQQGISCAHRVAAHWLYRKIGG
jgi:hypothetical protein